MTAGRTSGPLLPGQTAVPWSARPTTFAAFPSAAAYDVHDPATWSNRHWRRS